MKEGAPKSIEKRRGGGGWTLCLEEFWTISAVVMPKIRFSNDWLITISMIYVYIKPEVKKNDITPMNAALNKACIGRLYLNCYLWGGFFWCGKWAIFLLLGSILPLSTWFPPKVCKKMQDSLYLVGTTSKIKGWGTSCVRWRI